MRRLPAFCRRTLVLCLFTLPLWAAEALQPMDPKEAEELLRLTEKTKPPVGSFRAYKETQTKDGSRTTTKLTRRTEQGKFFFRTEVVQTYNGHPEKTWTKLTLGNEDGTWQIYGKKAVLMPTPIDFGKAMREAARLGGQLKEGGAVAEATVTNPTDDETQRLVKMALRIRQHTHYTGERFEEGERKLARVSRIYDEEARRVFAQIADEQIANAKKGMSFGMRILASSVLAVTDVGAHLPVREVYLIEEETTKVLETERFNAGGKSLGKSQSETPEPIEEVPLETFAVPAGIERLRPKNFGEAIELTKKLDDQERASRKRAEQ